MAVARFSFRFPLFKPAKKVSPLLFLLFLLAKFLIPIRPSMENSENIKKSYAYFKKTCTATVTTTQRLFSGETARPAKNNYVQARRSEMEYGNIAAPPYDYSILF